MMTMHMIAMLGFGLTVSACTAIEVPSRDATFDPVISTTQVSASGSAQATPGAARPLDLMHSPVTVQAVTVRVPRSLRVSESNGFLPAGDIVWREDPIGDRHTQVQKIFEDALLTGVQPLNGSVPVNIDVKVRRFHALTEKARYTTGGTHSITFDLAITAPDTGELIVPVRTVRADLPAFGGQQALNAERRGLTQKVRISDHLAEVIRQELTQKDGCRNANLGFYQMLNNI